MTNKPHKHAEVIKQWANGHKVEYRRPGDTLWVEASDPAWVDDYEYRTKPAREYPVSRMTITAFEEIMHRGNAKSEHPLNIAVKIANESIRHAIDASQVIPVGEIKEVARNLAREEAKRIIDIMALDMARMTTSIELGMPSNAEIKSTAARLVERYRKALL